ncbi:MAG: alpha/beta fold hydrolase [Parachlamydiales bacterium]|jgi:hypothetical protein
MQIERLEFPGRFLNGHIQTVLGSLGRRHKLHHPFFHHTLTLSDGDQLSCEESRPTLWNPHQPTTIMVHGLGGDQNSRYMLRMGKHLLEEGHRVIRANLRSCGPRYRSCRCIRPYHGGLSDDIFNIVKHFQVKTSPTVALGYSLGGNILLKLAGERKEEMGHYLKGMVTVCPPFDLSKTVQKILATKLGFYQTYFVVRLRSQYKQWADNNPELNPPKLPYRMSIKDFDDFHTAPRWGFRDAEHYYESSSCAPFISDITVPCDIICSDDDPVVDIHTLYDLHLPKNVKVLKATGGGHMGFLGSPFHPHGVRWIERVLLNLIRNKLAL